MSISSITPQLRTTDMASSIHFYTEKLGFTVEFNYEGFYVGLNTGGRHVTSSASTSQTLRSHTLKRAGISISTSASRTWPPSPIDSGQTEYPW
jgi:catechol 2,3-dioxygenase-like lactoylglutathione lyase family enzyme